MTQPFRINQRVIVTPPPGQGAPYGARYGQRAARHGFVYVRGPGGLHAVAEGTVAPMSPGLGDDKALRHAANPNTMRSSANNG